MATQLQIRRGTTSQMSAFTGAEGELAVNTTTDTVHVHDGSTAGGHALAKADGSNIATYAGSFTTIAASGTITGNVTGNLTGNVTGNITGSVLTAAQTNITSLGSLTGLTVTGAFTSLGIDDNANATAITIDSSENVGIGTTSPTAVLDVRRGDASGAVAEFHTSTGFGIELGSSQSEAYIEAGSNQALLFNTNASNERMRITSAGLVGIGRVPRVGLDVAGEVAIAYDATYGLRFYNQPQNNWAFIGNDVTTSGADLRLGDSTGEVMRLSGGNLLVGKTSTAFGTAGAALYASGDNDFVNDGNVMSLNRLNSDGSIINLYKDSTAVGSIGVSGGNNIYISGMATNHAGLTFATDAILPTRQGATTNNVTDLGASTDRFKDLYLKTISAQRGDAGTLIQASSASGAGSGIINFMSSLTSSSNNASCAHYQGTTQGIASYKLLGNGSSTWSSDINLKRDVETTRDGYLEDVKALRVVKYKWKNDPDSGLELGLIAQEVEAIFPSLVTEDKNAIGDEVLYTADDQIPEGKDVGDVKLEGTTYKGVKYSVLPIIILKAMQEQQATIEALTQRIETLENN